MVGPESAHEPAPEAAPGPRFHESGRKLGAVVAAIAFLPFLAGALLGRTFYYRDLVVSFFPLRRFALEGLRRGEVRFWNPYVHEGEQLAFPAISYPVELLQLLWPDERGFSLLLALHVPAAALAFMVLARSFALGPLAAAGAGLVYALGGFTLSSLNLYFYLPAMAWAPLVVWGLRRAAEGGARRMAEGAVLTGIAISTLGMEITLQALLVGVLLAWRGREAARAFRVAGTVLLGCGLGAPFLLHFQDLLPESGRAGGMSVGAVLAYSLHPLVLGQVVVQRFFGDMSDLPRSWWGQNFFSGGYPYFQSLYLGASALGLAFVGAARPSPWRWRLVALAGFALFVSLGHWGGWEPIVALHPVLRTLRSPVKAFFTVHFVVCLFASFGLQALVSGADGAWRRLTLVTLGAGSLLVAASLVPHVLPDGYRWFLSNFLPPYRPWPVMLESGSLVLADAATGGLFALLVGLVALAVERGRAAALFGSLAIAGLVAGDLVRAGAAVNSMVTSSFYRLSPEVDAELALLRSGGRVFTCEPHGSREFKQALPELIAAHRPLDPWSYGVLLQTLYPNTNVNVSVPTAFGVDHTMLFARSRVLLPEEADCRPFSAIAERLHRAAVRFVVSLDPLDDAELALRSEIRFPSIAPLTIHVYSLRDALPRLRFVAAAVRRAANGDEALARAEPTFLLAEGTAIEDSGPETEGVEGEITTLEESPGRIRMIATASGPTAVVVRDSFAPGWRARVNGEATPVRRADGRHLAVRIPAGKSEVSLRYIPPHLRPGLLLSAGAALVTLALWSLGRRRRTVAL